MTAAHPPPPGARVRVVGSDASAFSGRVGVVVRHEPGHGPLSGRTWVVVEFADPPVEAPFMPEELAVVAGEGAADRGG